MNKKWFTLIEIIIVTMILSIITIVIAPRISGHLAQARDTKRQMDLRQIGAALELYRNNHGNYPGFAGMIAADGSFSDDDNAYQISPVTLALSGLVKEGYITSLPKDPSSNNGIRVFDGLFTHNNSEKGVLQRGEYGYMPLKNGSYILIAQTETEDKSNWIWNSSREGYGNPLRIWWENPYDAGLKYGWRTRKGDANYAQNTCSSFEKVNEGNLITQIFPRAWDPRRPDQTGVEWRKERSILQKTLSNTSSAKEWVIIPEGGYYSGGYYTGGWYKTGINSWWNLPIIMISPIPDLLYEVPIIYGNSWYNTSGVYQTGGYRTGGYRTSGWNEEYYNMPLGYRSWGYWSGSYYDPGYYVKTWSSYYLPFEGDWSYRSWGYWSGNYYDPGYYSGNLYIKGGNLYIKGGNNDYNNYNYGYPTNNYPQWYRSGGYWSGEYYQPGYYTGGWLYYTGDSNFYDGRHHEYNDESPNFWYAFFHYTGWYYSGQEYITNYRIVEKTNTKYSGSGAYITKDGYRLFNGKLIPWGSATDGLWGNADSTAKSIGWYLNQWEDVNKVTNNVIKETSPLSLVDVQGLCVYRSPQDLRYIYTGPQ